MCAQHSFSTCCHAAHARIFICLFCLSHCTPLLASSLRALPIFPFSAPRGSYQTSAKIPILSYSQRSIQHARVRHRATVSLIYISARHFTATIAAAACARRTSVVLDDASWPIWRERFNVLRRGGLRLYCLLLAGRGERAIFNGIASTGITPFSARHCSILRRRRTLCRVKMAAARVTSAISV